MFRRLLVSLGNVMAANYEKPGGESGELYSGGAVADIGSTVHYEHIVLIFVTLRNKTGFEYGLISFQFSGDISNLRRLNDEVKSGDKTIYLIQIMSQVQMGLIFRSQYDEGVPKIQLARVQCICEIRCIMVALKMIQS